MSRNRGEDLNPRTLRLGGDWMRHLNLPGTSEVFEKHFTSEDTTGLSDSPFSFSQTYGVSLVRSILLPPSLAVRLEETARAGTEKRRVCAERGS